MPGSQAACQGGGAFCGQPFGQLQLVIGSAVRKQEQRPRSDPLQLHLLEDAVGTPGGETAFRLPPPGRSAQAAPCHQGDGDPRILLALPGQQGGGGQAHHRGVPQLGVGAIEHILQPVSAGGENKGQGDVLASSPHSLPGPVDRPDADVPPVTPFGVPAGKCARHDSFYSNSAIGMVK